MGDRVYLIKGERGAAQTVWLSYWERPGMARTFRRQVEKRLRARFQDARWCVRRDGRLVAAVWAGGSAGSEACEALAECALQTCVEVDRPSLAGSWCNDLPWPVRFPVYEGHSAGCELLGGYAADLQQGPAFCRYNVASGLVLNVESTPDRHHVSTCFGLLRHVGDVRSDFTYWNVPLLATWHRQGSGEAERYRWRLLWGLLADGNERRSRVLFIPVWRKG